MTARPKICLIGGGNITNLRHVPALLKIDAADVVGVIAADADAATRTAARIKNARSAVIDAESPFTDQAAGIDWFAECDAVVIGTPPRTHHPLAAACLKLGKHVLTEKPMAMNAAEARDLVDIGQAAGKNLAVMHNFQFSNGVQRLERLLKAGELGDVVSVFMTQFTSRERRLPKWYKDLPLGLFFDEAAHFFYVLRRLVGPVSVLDGFGQFGPDPADQTPVLMSVELLAGGTPVHLSINFNAPVCEWLFVVSGSRKMAIYDFFRDILIVAPNDGQHYAMDILRTSSAMTIQHWTGFVANGVRLVTGQLHYGVDVVMGKYIAALTGAPLDPAVSGQAGLDTVTAMSAVVDAVARRSHRLAASAP
jgi:scyllo-inositol 2-dehydrogenase (NADP+)